MATFSELFTPKLVTVLRDGYGMRAFRSDLVAGLTVAVVALPLSMAIAIASGATPAQGLYTAIIGGFLVSALGGSRFQIGGPAGAFIVLVAATVAQHGIDGLILATAMAGLFMMAAGFLRLGTYIKFIPYPVTVGFTAGIAVIIFASQLRELLGLSPSGTEPGPLIEKLRYLWGALPTFGATAFAVSLVTIGVIAAQRRFRPHWPGMLIAVTFAALAVWAFSLPVETIGSRFGGIPSGLPAPSLPEMSWAKIKIMLPSAVSFALLGAIESLLSAVVADAMTGRRHRSNCELVAQGAANVGSALFGGICVTGTIARTATNVRAGAHGPMAGILHAAFLLAFMLVAAPLASYIPLAALAGVLAVVAWNMIERDAILTLLRANPGEASVLSVTFLLTIFRDLTEAIVVGFALGAVVFIARMSRATSIETATPFVPGDKADDRNGDRTKFHKEQAADPDIVVYRIRGAFFFGAAASIGAVLDQISDTAKALILDLSAVPFIDSTAAAVIESLEHKMRKRGIPLILIGTTHELRQELFSHEIKPPLVRYEPNLKLARSYAAKRVERP